MMLRILRLHTQRVTHIFLIIFDFCMKFILSAFTLAFLMDLKIFSYFNKRSFRIKAAPNNREDACIYFSIMSKLLTPQQQFIYIKTSKIISFNRHFLLPYVWHFKYAEKMSRNFPVPLITLHGYIDRKHSSYSFLRIGSWGTFNQHKISFLTVYNKSIFEQTLFLPHFWRHYDVIDC